MLPQLCVFGEMHRTRSVVSNRERSFVVVPLEPDAPQKILKAGVGAQAVEDWIDFAEKRERGAFLDRLCEPTEAFFFVA